MFHITNIKTMKRTIFMIIAIALIGCSTPEKKAEKLIKEYMQTNLKDPASYEPVSFGKMDSLFEPYIATKEGRELFDLSGITGFYGQKTSKLRMQIATAKTRKELDVLEDSINYYLDKAKEYEKLFDENDKNYTGEFVGWVMEHKYRAKNGFGALDLGEENIYFNKDITEIVKPYGKRRK